MRYPYFYPYPFYGGAGYFPYLSPSPYFAYTPYPVYSSGCGGCCYPYYNRYFHGFW